MFTEPIFSVKDVADLLNIPKLLVYKLINVGKLKAYMNNKKEGYRITQEDFKAYCAEKEVNFEEILEKYYKRPTINLRVSPQNDNSILGYPPNPYNTGYTSPNMYYDPTYSNTNRESLEVMNHQGPKDPKNPHNSLYTTGEIGIIFGIDALSFYTLLERLGFIYRIGDTWNATVPLIRFGLVKYDLSQKALLWTYIGKRFLEDQLIYEVGCAYTSSEKNRELVRKIISYTM